MGSVVQTFGRFLAAGILNTVLTYLLFVALSLWFPYRIAYTIIFAAGVVGAYALNSRFVFGTSPSLRTGSLNLAVYVIQYLVGFAVLASLVDAFRTPPAVAALAAIAVNVPLTFLLLRVVFKP